MILAFVFTCFAQAEDSKHPKMDLFLSALKKAKIEVNDIKIEKHEQGSPLPNSYEERISFSLKSVAPKGGQFFVFSKAKYADYIYFYYDALKALAGPYLYKSKDGLIVAQLNSGLSVMEAEKIEELMNSFELPKK